MNIDIDRNKKYYLSNPTVCTCDACQYYVKVISHYCPEIKEYLELLGIDIALPFETLWIEDYDKNELFFIEAQYIVFGKCEKDWTDVVGSHSIFKSENHPSSNLEEEHFVISITGIHLPWERDSKLEDVFALSRKKKVSFFRKARNKDNKG